VSNPNLNILKARESERFMHVSEPFHGPGHEGHDHDGHEGHDATGAHGAEKKVSYFDTRKLRSDEGYALSLRVLSPEAVHSSTGGMA
jgi:hypothetical protein